ncbi:CvpA family protein [Lacticaseibacillus hulanensis]|uniref:CvpA family protein n=1 Tax=Lacticaseibacillus hulanensis TaxID=2493111 RepID=UPI0013E370B2|nr:CvpA family protein [Lacticaseibacillus hulanensis]
MIFTIIIGIWLIASIVNGWKRGLVSTFITLASSIVLWIAAFIWYKPLAETIGSSTDPGLGTRILAFFLIVIVGHIFFNMLAALSRTVTWIPGIKQVNGIGGALVAGALNYVLIFITLTILLMTQSAWVEQQYESSTTAQFITAHMPLINANKIQNWLGNVDTHNNPDNNTTDINSNSTSTF